MKLSLTPRLSEVTRKFLLVLFREHFTTKKFQKVTNINLWFVYYKITKSQRKFLNIYFSKIVYKNFDQKCLFIFNSYFLNNFSVQNQNMIIFIRFIVNYDIISKNSPEWPFGDAIL